jgi:hypothetical protein
MSAPTTANTPAWIFTSLLQDFHHRRYCRQRWRVKRSFSWLNLHNGLGLLINNDLHHRTHVRGDLFL